MSDVKLGHCLHCDLATVTNAWIESGKVTPTEVLEALAGVTAYLIARAAKPGSEGAAMSSMGDMIAVKFLAIQSGDNARSGIHHTAGHG